MSTLPRSIDTLLLVRVLLPPQLQPLLDHFPRSPILDQNESDSQLRLDLSVPRLIVEEDHLVVRYRSLPMNLLEMTDLGSCSGGQKRILDLEGGENVPG